MSAAIGTRYGANYLISRRIIQLGLLVLFWLGAQNGTQILTGNLSAAKLLAKIPLVDPFALLQVVATGHWVPQTAWLGAGIVFVAYVVLGRVFCSWVCPLNMVTDLAGWLRQKLGLIREARISRATRYWVMVLALVVSAIVGVAAFEWVSPIAMLHRELIFGAGLGLLAAAGIFVVDLLVLKNGWCGTLCPLGAFYSLIGRIPLFRAQFHPERCDRCLDCVRVCPEPQVINFKTITQTGRVVSGECTNCMRCVEVCPTRAFNPALRLFWRPLAATKGGGHHED